MAKDKQQNPPQNRPRAVVGAGPTEPSPQPPNARMTPPPDEEPAAAPEAPSAPVEAPPPGRRPVPALTGARQRGKGKATVSAVGGPTPPAAGTPSVGSFARKDAKPGSKAVPSGGLHALLARTGIPMPTHSPGRARKVVTS